MCSNQANSPYSSNLRNDDSDRKSLDVLITRISQLEKKSQDVTHPNSTRRSSRITKIKSVQANGIGRSKSGASCSKISSGKVKATLQDNGVTITDKSKLIKKSPKKDVRSRSKAPKTRSKKQKKSPDKWRQSKLTETFTKTLEKHSTKPSKEEKKVKTAKTLTKSFEKYNVKIPSHEEIMAYRKQSEQEKEALEKLRKEMDDSLESDINFNIDEPVVREDVEVLDCKHLTDDEVKEYFNKNLQHMHEIHNGVSSTARSEKFKKGGNTCELRYNTSSCTFTYEQKQLLYSLLHDKFGNENFMCTNDQYFFQVLIPEVCLRIFMDVHNMTLKEATNYLDNAPVKIRI